MEHSFDPFNRDERATANHAASLRVMEERIVAALANRPGGMSGSELAQAISGKRITIDETLRLMWGAGRVVALPRARRGGGVLWTLPV